MRPTPSVAIERCRVTHGPNRSNSAYGNNGHFRIMLSRRVALSVIASDGMGWEHVSVSVVGANRCPTWDEMCKVKDLFWSEEEIVLQYHPAKDDYVNVHPYVLHLWRPVDQPVPTPPIICV